MSHPPHPGRPPQPPPPPGAWPGQGHHEYGQRPGAYPQPYPGHPAPGAPYPAHGVPHPAPYGAPAGYGAPYPAQGRPPVPGAVTAVRVMVFLSSVLPLLAGVGFAVSAVLAAIGMWDSVESPLVNAVVALGFLGVGSGLVLLGVKAGRPRPWVMWTITVVYGVSVLFNAAAMLIAPGALGSMVYAVVVLSLTLSSKDYFYSERRARRG